MGKIYVQGKPDHREIKLQTRLGHDIDNNQDWDFSVNEKVPDFSKDYSRAIPRNNPNPFYNCYGKTFASSRTMIGIESVRMILDDDGYTEISKDNILPGDIIIYYDLKGEVVHSGVVVRKQDPQSIYPWVVSKWGMLNEFCHLAYDCPYQPFSKMDYWRITK